MVKLFDEIPCLEDDRIVLRKLDGRDTEALLELTGSESVYRYLPTYLHEKQYTDMDLMLRDLYGKCFLRKENLILGICLKEEGALCGLAEFYGFRDEIHKISVGYRLLERYWGKGIATQTVALMVDYLYGRTDTEIITASTMVENLASAHVLEKNGFLKTASGVPEDWGYPEPTIAGKWFR